MPFRAEIHHIDRVRNESRLVLVHLEVHLSLCLQLGRAHHVCHLEFFFSLRLLPILSIVLGVRHLQEGLLLRRQCLCSHCFVTVAALVWGELCAGGPLWGEAHVHTSDYVLLGSFNPILLQVQFCLLLQRCNTLFIFQLSVKITRNGLQVLVQVHSLRKGIKYDKYITYCHCVDDMLRIKHHPTCFLANIICLISNVV